MSMPGLLGDRRGLRDASGDGCRRLCWIGSRDDAVVGVNDLAQLDELLEAAQVAADLRAQRLGKEPGDLPAQLATRWAEGCVEDDLGASASRCGAEAHLARRVERGPFRGLPGNSLHWGRIGDLDVPVERDASRSGQAPARSPVA